MYSKFKNSELNIMRKLDYDLIERFEAHYFYHEFTGDFLHNIRTAIDKWLDKYNPGQSCRFVIDINDGMIYYECDLNILVSVDGKPRSCPIVHSIPIYEIQDSLEEILDKEFKDLL